MEVEQQSLTLDGKGTIEYIIFRSTTKFLKSNYFKKITWGGSEWWYYISSWEERLKFNEDVMEIGRRVYLPSYFKIRFEYDYWDHPRVQEVFSKVMNNFLCCHTRDSRSVTLYFRYGNKI